MQVRLSIDEIRERCSRLRPVVREASFQAMCDLKDISEELELLYRDIEALRAELEAWKP